MSKPYHVIVSVQASILAQANQLSSELGYGDNAYRIALSNVEGGTTPTHYAFATRAAPEFKALLEGFLGAGSVPEGLERDLANAAVVRPGMAASFELITDPERVPVVWTPEDAFAAHLAEYGLYRIEVEI